MQADIGCTAGPYVFSAAFSILEVLFVLQKKARSMLIRSGLGFSRGQAAAGVMRPRALWAQVNSWR
jgi:hypothetical protein